MLRYWIWFAELKNISLQQKHHLLEHFGDPEELYNSADAVFQRMGLPQTQREALQNKDLGEVETILRNCRQKNIGLLPIKDAAYPERLRNTPDAPILLYYKGILPDWRTTAFIGIVGTRKASAYGLQTAFQMGSQVAAGGGCVVSGGASGADTAALQGALESGAPVVAVLGGGVDVVYPRNNRKLFQTITQQGCLISEYPPQTQALGWHFPVRNRIISGISNGVLVVEAPQKSGALITAHHALEQGRDVFVVPGNINTESCAGSNALLQEGAVPVFSGWDVLRDYESLYPGKLKQHKDVPLYVGERSAIKVAQKSLNPMENQSVWADSEKKFIDKPINSTYSGLNNEHPAFNDTEQAILALLTHQPQEPAELIAKLGMSSGKVLSVLTMLAVKGIVQKHPGGRVSLK